MPIEIVDLKKFNLERFGIEKTPLLFENTIHSDIYDPLPPITKLTVKDIRANTAPGIIQYKYAILADGELIITEPYSNLLPLNQHEYAHYNGYTRNRGNDFALFQSKKYHYLDISHSERIFFDINTRKPIGRVINLAHPEIAGLKPVVFAGDFYVSNGEILSAPRLKNTSAYYGIDDWSGHYLCAGTDGKTIVEHVFVRHGFTEARGSFHYRISDMSPNAIMLRRGQNIQNISLPHPGPQLSLESRQQFWRQRNVIVKNQRVNTIALLDPSSLPANIRGGISPMLRSIGRGTLRGMPLIVNGTVLGFRIFTEHQQNPRGPYVQDAIYGFGVGTIAGTPLMFLGPLAVPIAIMDGLPDVKPDYRNIQSELINNSNGLGPVLNGYLLEQVTQALVFQQFSRAVMSPIHRLEEGLQSVLQSPTYFFEMFPMTPLQSPIQRRHLEDIEPLDGRIDGEHTSNYLHERRYRIEESMQHLSTQLERNAESVNTRMQETQRSVQSALITQNFQPISPAANARLPGVELNVGLNSDNVLNVLFDTNNITLPSSSELSLPTVVIDQSENHQLNQLVLSNNEIISANSAVITIPGNSVNVGELAPRTTSLTISREPDSNNSDILPRSKPNIKTDIRFGLIPGGVLFAIKTTKGSAEIISSVIQNYRSTTAIISASFETIFSKVFIKLLLVNIGWSAALSAPFIAVQIWLKHKQEKIATRIKHSYRHAQQEMQVLDQRSQKLYEDFQNGQFDEHFFSEMNELLKALNDEMEKEKSRYDYAQDNKSKGARNAHKYFIYGSLLPSLQQLENLKVQALLEKTRQETFFANKDKTASEVYSSLKSATDKPSFNQNDVAVITTLRALFVDKLSAMVVSGQAEEAAALCEKAEGLTYFEPGNIPKFYFSNEANAVGKSYCKTVAQEINTNVDNINNAIGRGETPSYTELKQFLESKKQHFAGHHGTAKGFRIDDLTHFSDKLSENEKKPVTPKNLNLTYLTEFFKKIPEGKQNSNFWLNEKHLLEQGQNPSFTMLVTEEQKKSALKFCTNAYEVTTYKEAHELILANKYSEAHLLLEKLGVEIPSERKEADALIHASHFCESHQDKEPDFWLNMYQGLWGTIETSENSSDFKELNPTSREVRNCLRSKADNETTKVVNENIAKGDYINPQSKLLTLKALVPDTHVPVKESIEILKHAELNKNNSQNYWLSYHQDNLKQGNNYLFVGRPVFIQQYLKQVNEKSSQGFYDQAADDLESAVNVDPELKPVFSPLININRYTGERQVARTFEAPGLAILQRHKDELNIPHLEKFLKGYSLVEAFIPSPIILLGQYLGALYTGNMQEFTEYTTYLHKNTKESAGGKLAIEVTVKLLQILPPTENLKTIRNLFTTLAASGLRAYSFYSNLVELYNAYMTKKVKATTLQSATALIKDFADGIVLALDYYQRQHGVAKEDPEYYRILSTIETFLDVVGQTSVMAKIRGNSKITAASATLNFLNGIDAYYAKNTMQHAAVKALENCLDNIDYFETQKNMLESKDEDHLTYAQIKNSRFQREDGDLFVARSSIIEAYEIKENRLFSKKQQLEDFSNRQQQSYSQLLKIINEQFRGLNHFNTDAPKVNEARHRYLHREASLNKFNEVIENTNKLKEFPTLETYNLMLIRLYALASQAETLSQFSNEFNQYAENFENSALNNKNKLWFERHYSKCREELKKLAESVISKSLNLAIREKNKTEKEAYLNLVITEYRYCGVWQDFNDERKFFIALCFYQLGNIEECRRFKNEIRDLLSVLRQRVSSEVLELLNIVDKSAYNEVLSNPDEYGVVDFELQMQAEKLVSENKLDELSAWIFETEFSNKDYYLYQIYYKTQNAQLFNFISDLQKYPNKRHAFWELFNSVILRLMDLSLKSNIDENRKLLAMHIICLEKFFLFDLPYNAKKSNKEDLEESKEKLLMLTQRVRTKNPGFFQEPDTQLEVETFLTEMRNKMLSQNAANLMSELRQLFEAAKLLPEENRIVEMSNQ